MKKLLIIPLLAASSICHALTIDDFKIPQRSRNYSETLLNNSSDFGNTIRSIVAFDLPQSIFIRHGLLFARKGSAEIKYKFNNENFYKDYKFIVIKSVFSIGKANVNVVIDGPSGYNYSQQFSLNKKIIVIHIGCLNGTKNTVNVDSLSLRITGAENYIGKIKVELK